MAAPVAAVRALPVVVRAIAKPQVFKRFLGTKAGKKAAFKWGKMLLNSKMTGRSIDKLMNRMESSGQDSKEYKRLQTEYKKLQKKIAELERQLESVQNDNADLETKTFTLGRQVVQMRQLYQHMLNELQKQQQMIIANSYGHTR